MVLIHETGAKLGLGADDLVLFGSEIAKLKPRAVERHVDASSGRVILVSAITPTPAGEGKTTTSIGLAQALAKLGESVCLALREPSLGPCFGVKGGGTGGGECQVLPTDRINLHFTGDFHAVTAAHNLLAALLDNQIYFDNEFRIDPRRIAWRRVVDVNDRALRHIVIGLGGRRDGVTRETGFDITAASELMAMLCLAEDECDLRARIDRTVLAYAHGGAPITAGDLSATGAVLALLRDALLPNLVATTEGVPALIHGGPFANIAHGCSSVVATKSAMRLADWTITEAGFGFDLGAEKFFDIKCRSAGLDAAVVVLVATIRALKLHGGRSLSELEEPNADAVERGLTNLEKHVENVCCFGKTPVVAINRFATDSDDEISVVRRRCEELGLPFAVSDHYVHGGAGAIELAQTVMDAAGAPGGAFRPLYQLNDSIPEKVQAVASKMYGAREVSYTRVAVRDLQEIDRLGYSALPVCIAKTPSSLSDDPKLRGRPKGFEITVQDVQLNSGAGFVVVLTGDIIRMPGLPREPIANAVDLVDGEIIGLK